MSELRIRRAGPRDAVTIAEFNVAMAAETEDKGLDADTLADGVRRAIDDDRHGFYLVAERHGQPVGCLMVTFEWSDWRNGQMWWIQSVYVPAEARRTGVYRALSDEVRRLGAAEGVIGYRLYVEKDNNAAQATYRALGMKETPYRLYEVFE